MYVSDAKRTRGRKDNENAEKLGSQTGFTSADGTSNGKKENQTNWKSYRAEIIAAAWRSFEKNWGKSEEKQIARWAKTKGISSSE